MHYLRDRAGFFGLSFEDFRKWIYEYRVLKHADTLNVVIKGHGKFYINTKIHRLEFSGKVITYLRRRGEVKNIVSEQKDFFYYSDTNGIRDVTIILASVCLKHDLLSLVERYADGFELSSEEMRTLIFAQCAYEIVVVQRKDSLHLNSIY
jgi:hypothetical protein